MTSLMKLRAGVRRRLDSSQMRPMLVSLRRVTVKKTEWTMKKRPKKHPKARKRSKLIKALNKKRKLKKTRIVQHHSLK